MRYDFIEIGAGAGDTLLQSSTDEAVGITIEPIQAYLDCLPDRPNKKKLAVAVVAAEDVKRDLSFYYIDPKDVSRHGLCSWMTQCNKLGVPHDMHTSYYPDLKAWAESTDRSTLETKDLTKLGIVKCEKLPTITYAQLVEDHDISGVGSLKLDLEGYDCSVLTDILDVHEIRRLPYPDLIQFESNCHADQRQVEGMKRRLTFLGYKLTETDSDTVAEKT